jgi:hypothetical protein
MIFGIFEVLVAVSSVVLISKDVIPIEQREKIYWADTLLAPGLSLFCFGLAYGIC